MIVVKWVIVTSRGVEAEAEISVDGSSFIRGLMM